MTRVVALPDVADPFTLRTQFRELERYDPGVRYGDDPEDLHRFRVATRRTRAIVRATQPLLGDVLEPLSNELAWLAGVLGPVRDLDVLIDHLRGNVEQLDADRPAGEELVAILEEQRARVRDDLGEAMASERYFDLLMQFEREVAAIADQGDVDVVSLAEKAFKRLRRDARALGNDPEDDSVHELRKAGKRARYAAELLLPVGGRSLERYIDAVKELQDVVGAHQDAVVAEERLRAIARARTAIAAGRLIDGERKRRADARRALPATLDAVLERGRAAFSVPLLLVRHASAGHRAEWNWHDRDRPLDERGRGQAARLPEKLESFRIERILSSPYLRCVETIAPLAAARGLQPELRGELSPERQATEGIELVRSLAGQDVVICGHGGLEYALPNPPRWKKGMIFVVGPHLELIRKLRA